MYQLLRALAGAGAAVVLLSACAANQAGGANVGYQEIAAGQHSGIYKHYYTVIRDDRTFSTLWKRARARRYPTPNPPLVDFSRYMVIALFTGERRTGGYDIGVAKITRTWSGLLVNVRINRPGEGCATTQALTQPFVFVKTPVSVAPVHFVTQKVSEPCD